MQWSAEVGAVALEDLGFDVLDQTRNAPLGLALRKGVAALCRILDCGPFVMGSDLSLADVIAAFAFPVASMVTWSVYGWHLAEAVPGLPATLASLGERPSVRQLSAEADAGMAAFRARLRARHAPSG